MILLTRECTRAVRISASYPGSATDSRQNLPMGKLILSMQASNVAILAVILPRKGNRNRNRNRKRRVERSNAEHSLSQL